MTNLLFIKNLHVSIEGKKILKGLNLEIPKGEIHAIMGPNGAGKSTLAKVLSGHPAYEITKGEVYFKGEDLLPLAPEERALKGIFMSFQYPPEIPGVSSSIFLFHAVNAKRKFLGKEALSKEAFQKLLDETLAFLGISHEFKEREQNVGYSGGEKKRNEILQMALLAPELSILDETDSGLDVDALKIVSEGVLKLKKEKESLLVITHYIRLLHHLMPKKVHILMQGQIVETGGIELANHLEEKGYNSFS